MERDSDHAIWRVDEDSPFVMILALVASQNFEIEAFNRGEEPEHQLYLGPITTRNWIAVAFQAFCLCYAHGLRRDRRGPGHNRAPLRPFRAMSYLTGMMIEMHERHPENIRVHVSVRPSRRPRHRLLIFRFDDYHGDGVDLFPTYVLPQLIEDDAERIFDR